MKKLIRNYTFVIVILIIFGAELSAQEYKIGPSDELSVTFWQQPQLNTNVRVSQNGTIVLPIIGSITAAGLTPNELSSKIVRRISLFNQNISQASVVVKQYGSKTVYVIGNVLRPGKYSFEAIPDVWKIILEAGGASGSANLNQIEIIRGGDQAGEIVKVNLARYLRGGDLTELPPVYAGDTIRVPRAAAGMAGSPGAAAGQAPGLPAGEDIIYVYGQVANPGGYPFSDNLSLLEAIIIAGGPGIDAKMDEVKIITRGSPYSSVATVDLDRYSKMGTPAPFLLNPGDTIFIPQKKGVFSAGGYALRLVSIAISAFTTAVIYQWIRRGRVF